MCCVENPVVRDELWDTFYHKDRYCNDVAEPETVRVIIDVETNAMTDREVDDLIDCLEMVSYQSNEVCGEGFTVDYDLEANIDNEGEYKQIVLIELRGECEENVYDTLIEVLNNEKVDYCEK